MRELKYVLKKVLHPGQRTTHWLIRASLVALGLVVVGIVAGHLLVPLVGMHAWTILHRFTCDSDPGCLHNIKHLFKWGTAYRVQIKNGHFGEMFG